MKRVMVVGGPGSGKSTLARRLHYLNGLPLFHLDRLYWRPGWKFCSRDEWRVLLSELAAHEEWIHGRRLRQHLRYTHAVIRFYGSTFRATLPFRAF